MNGASKGYFVTGTDTGIGKTWISLGLMACLQSQGLRVTGMKPVASGCELRPEGLVNQDAAALRAQASVELPYGQVNPYAFEPPIAPHLAAAAVGARISLDRILAVFEGVSAAVQCTVVEGVGGWLVPLNDQDTVADMAAVLGMPIILVVGIRLGCLNHALLSVADIERRGLPLAGWVANHLEPNSDWSAANVDSLSERIDAPLLGRIPYMDRTLHGPPVGAIAGCLNIGQAAPLEPS